MPTTMADLLRDMKGMKVELVLKCGMPLRGKLAELSGEVGRIDDSVERSPDNPADQADPSAFFRLDEVAAVSQLGADGKGGLRGRGF